jgi:hypothetical protein
VEHQKGRAQQLLSLSHHSFLCADDTIVRVPIQFESQIAGHLQITQRLLLLVATTEYFLSDFVSDYAHCHKCIMSPNSASELPAVVKIQQLEDAWSNDRLREENGGHCTSTVIPFCAYLLQVATVEKKNVKRAPSALSHSLEEAVIITYFHALLLTGGYSSVVNYYETKRTAQNPVSNDVDFVYLLYYMYSLYRLQQYTKVRDLFQTVRAAKPFLSTSAAAAQTILQHVYVQSLFHIAGTEPSSSLLDEILDMYEQLRLVDDGRGTPASAIDVFTNVGAVLATHVPIVPYCGRSIDHAGVFTRYMKHYDAIEEQVASLIKDGNCDMQSLPYDLVYNWASCLLFVDFVGDNKAVEDRRSPQSLLQLALRAAKVQNEDSGDGQMHSLISPALSQETTPIRLNLQWCRDYQNGTVTGITELGTSDVLDAVKHLPKSLQFSVRIEIVLAELLKADRRLSATRGPLLDIFPSPEEIKPFLLSPLQSRMYWYNLAILQLHLHQFQEAVESCRSIVATFNESNRLATAKKKKRATEAVSVTDDELWWESRIAVIQSNCHLRQSFGVAPAGSTDATDRSRSSSLTNQKSDTSPQHHLQESHRILSAMRLRLESELFRESQPPSSIGVLDHAFCYVLCHQCSLPSLITGDEADVRSEEHNAGEHPQIVSAPSGPSPETRGIHLLEHDLPLKVRVCSPAVLATLASLFHSTGRTSDTEQLLLQQVRSLNGVGLNSNSKVGSAVLADFYMSQGRYRAAADLYALGVDSTVASKVRYWQALSYVDPVGASGLWLAEATHVLDLIVDDNDTTFDVQATSHMGAVLENQEVPRIKTCTSYQFDSASPLLASGHQTLDISGGQPTVNTSVSKQKKSAAAQRRRSRQRAQYLASLESKGLYRPDRPTKPDQWRWVPKYERSYARRRGNYGGGLHRGAQGAAMSENETLKFDVVVRQAALRSDAGGQADGPSTARMTVSSSGTSARKGARRK